MFILQNELTKQQKRLADQNKAQKIMYQRMLGGVAKKMEKEQENRKSWVGYYLRVGYHDFNFCFLRHL